MKLLKVSTPDADKYREAFLVENDGFIIHTSKGFEHFISKSALEAISDFSSIWKLYSTVYNDNVYPIVEEL